MPSLGMVDCETNGWSVVTSAPSNSAFAGILAGFLFTGLVFLFQVPASNAQQQAAGRPTWAEAHAPVIALFSATFLDLGFASYLFGRVAGFSAEGVRPGDTDAVRTLCNAVWMEAMSASGMLAVGAAALVVALGYLLVTFESTVTYLKRLAWFTGIGVLLGAPLLQVFTSFNFYEQIWEWEKAGHGEDVRSAIALTVASAVVAVITGVWFYLSSHRRGGKNDHRKFLEYGAYGVALYAVLGPTFAAVVVEMPPEWLAAPTSSLVFGTIVVSLIFPAVIAALLAGGAAT